MILPRLQTGAARLARRPSVAQRANRLAAVVCVVAAFAGCKDDRPAASAPPPELHGRPIIEAGKSTDAPSDSPQDRSDDPASSAQTPTEAAMPGATPTEAALKPAATLQEKTPGLYPYAPFELLACFKYDKPMPGAKPGGSRADPFPANVKALDQKKITVVGFMAPLNLDEAGRVTEFMLMRNQLFCCYGKPLELNEWIEVVPADGHPIDKRLDMPLAVSGVLTVKEKTIEGMVIGLYHLEMEDLRPVEGKDAKPKPLPQ